MERRHIAAVGWAEPKRICLYRTNLGHQQKRLNLGKENHQCSVSSSGVLTRDEIFRLQLIPAAWREVHAEVRQAFVPRTDDALLRRTASCVMTR